MPGEIRKTSNWFATTHWTVVLSARDGNGSEAQSALENLCKTYWAPLYAYVRSRGHSVEEAQDLTQQFFAAFLEKEWLQHLKDRRGKFRSFLLTVLKHFLSDQRDMVQAQKRGGGRVLISLDQFEAEERSRLEPVNTLTPEDEFNRRWARNLIENAYQRLEAEYEANGRGRLFRELKDIQTGDGNGETYLEIGTRLGLSESAIKSAIHRMRQRHREVLFEEIGGTVDTREDLEDEIRHLIGLLGENR